MQLAVQKQLGTRSTLALLSSLLATPATLDQLHLDDRCLRCAIHSTRSHRNKSYSAIIPREGEIGTLRNSQRRNQHAKQHNGSRPTTTHRKPYGHSLTFQRHINTKLASEVASITQEEENTRHSPRSLSNYLNDSDTFRSQDWLLDPERVKFESDVGHSRDIGAKLVDDPDLANNFKLWKQLLLYRKRHYGDDGVIDIWKGLRERGQPIDLPVEGEYASLFWRNFIMVGWKRDDFLNEIHSYASELFARSGKAWDSEKFYKSVVIGLFKAGRFSKGVEWHEKLKDTHLSNPNAMLLLLFEPAVSIDGGLRAFRKLCRSIDNHQIYCHIVPFLLNAGRIADAFAMHDFLLQRNDLPRSIEDVKPLIQHLRYHGSKAEIELFLANLKWKGLFQDEKSVISLAPKRGRPANIYIPTEVERDEEEEVNAVNDKLGARLFATKTFTFELILAGIKAFGATTIKPQTLRQMGLKAGDAKKLSEQIDILKKEGISIGNSAFSRVIQKLASEGNDSILNELLQSDLHPEVLDNLKTAEGLFNSYSIVDDPRRARMLFKILSILSTEDPYHYNILLRNAVHLRDWQKTLRILDQMREHDVAPQNIVRCGGQEDTALSETRNAGTPPSGEFSCKHVFDWRITKHDWEELRKLCLWLAHFYSPVKPKRSASASKLGTTFPDQPMSNLDQKKLLPPAHPESPLRQLFSVHLQYAIIAWGFNLAPNSKEIYQNPFSQEREKIIPWIRGHVLMRELKQKGVIVQMYTVRKVTRHRLSVLFGEYRVSSRPKNRMLRSTNPWTLEEILRDIDSVWGFSLFGKMAESDLYELVNPKPRVWGGKVQEGEEGRLRVSRQRKYTEEKLKVEKQLHDN
ncbi:hypothetical protein ACJ72_01106 [Emergomyces africanus]|uniref:Uncharacterized protein n=1 Tax=Emergomyces africanus TaxID=1955775 RepID=A0A1B7P658_9EURO|nr:hypothetical protein ACJ72_01106 [Emergomyces africanus]